MSRLVRGWLDLRRFRRLPDESRTYVFYAESAADWPHLGPLVRHLAGPLGRRIAYVTSDPDDDVLKARMDGVSAFYVGNGLACTLFFQMLRARVMVMTLTDLDVYHLKRSIHPVHYVYLFHAMSSTHVVYRPRAFDAYDTILCVGRHHLDEIRAAEALTGAPAKRLVRYGYGRLDSILQARATDSPPTDQKHVIVAPSWGPSSLIESSIGETLLRILLDAGFRVTLRLHPMTVRHRPMLARQLRTTFAGQGLVVETDMSEQRSLQAASVMISDWSGAATEFAFGLERPVLFVDTPPKVNNPSWARLALPAIEQFIRADLGAVVDPGNLASIPDVVRELAKDTPSIAERIRAARDRWVFNVGCSVEFGCDALVAAAERASPPIEL